MFCYRGGGGVWLGLWLVASVVKIIMQYVSVIKNGEGAPLVLGDRIFTLAQALSIYCIFKKYMNRVQVGNIAKSISRCSFGIYLVHPFFINFLYKMMNITPTNFPVLGVEFAIPLLWSFVFLISWGTAFVLLKVPVLKNFL